MDYPVLNRAEFLIEHADVPCSLPTQNPMERMLAEASAVIAEQRIFSAFLACLLLEEITR